MRLLNSRCIFAFYNNVKFTKVEEKMGIHGQATCELTFGQDGECVGELIGKEGEGMANMFIMMNEARLMVGMEGAAIGNAAYLQAKAYSAERIQGRDATRRQEGRVAIIEHPDVRRMALDARAWNEGGRLFAAFVASELDRAKYHPDAEVRDASADLVALLTPVAKAFLTDRGFAQLWMASCSRCLPQMSQVREIRSLHPRPTVRVQRALPMP